MKAWTALLLVVLTLPYVAAAAASAHSCNGMGCGPCVKGEYHNHNDDRGGQCSSGPGYIAENGYRGQRFSPGAGALGATAALAVAAVALGRRSV